MLHIHFINNTLIWLQGDGRSTRKIMASHLATFNVCLYFNMNSILYFPICCFSNDGVISLVIFICLRFRTTNTSTTAASSVQTHVISPSVMRGPQKKNTREKHNYRQSTVALWLFAFRLGRTLGHRCAGDMMIEWSCCILSALCVRTALITHNEAVVAFWSAKATRTHCSSCHADKRRPPCQQRHRAYAKFTTIKHKTKKRSEKNNMIQQITVAWHKGLSVWVTN